MAPGGGDTFANAPPSVTAPCSRPANVIREFPARSAGWGCSGEDHERPPRRIRSHVGAAGRTRAGAVEGGSDQGPGADQGPGGPGKRGGPGKGADQGRGRTRARFGPGPGADQGLGWPERQVARPCPHPTPPVVPGGCRNTFRCQTQPQPGFSRTQGHPDRSRASQPGARSALPASGLIDFCQYMSQEYPYFKT